MRIRIFPCVCESCNDPDRFFDNLADEDDDAYPVEVLLSSIVIAVEHVDRDRKLKIWY